MEEELVFKFDPDTSSPIDLLFGQFVAEFQPYFFFSSE